MINRFWVAQRLRLALIGVACTGAQACRVPNPCDQPGAEPSSCDGKSIKGYMSSTVSAERVPSMTELRRLTDPPGEVCSTVGCVNGLHYGPEPEQALEIYYPQAGAAVRGVALHVHGGSWNSYVDTEVASWGPTAGWDIEYDRGIADSARRMVGQGWILVSLDYRGARWDGARQQPVNAFPAGLLDVKRAIRWTKRYLHEVKGFPTSLPFVGMGHSAGGHLVGLAAATATQSYEPDVPSELSSYSSRLQGAVNITGPFDIQLWLTENHHRLAHLFNDISEFLGCSVNGSSYPPSLTAQPPFPPCCTGSNLPVCYNPDGAAPVWHESVKQASVHLQGAGDAHYFDPADPPYYVAASTADGAVPPRTMCHPAAWYATHGRGHEFWVDVIEEGSPSSNPYQWGVAHSGRGLNQKYLEGFFAAVHAHPNGFPPPDPATANVLATEVCAAY